MNNWEPLKTKIHHQQ